MNSLLMSDTFGWDLCLVWVEGFSDSERCIEGKISVFSGCLLLRRFDRTSKGMTLAATLALMGGLSLCFFWVIC